MQSKNTDYNIETPAHSKAEEFLAEHNHCCLCGTDLTFSHEVDYVSLIVKETHLCSSCQIQSRAQEHPLQ